MSDNIPLGSNLLDTFSAGTEISIQGQNDKFIVASDGNLYKANQLQPNPFTTESGIEPVAIDTSVVGSTTQINGTNYIVGSDNELYLAEQLGPADNAIAASIPNAPGDSIIINGTEHIIGNDGLPYTIGQLHNAPNLTLAADAPEVTGVISNTAGDIVTVNGTKYTVADDGSLYINQLDHNFAPINNPTPFTPNNATTIGDITINPDSSVTNAGSTPLNAGDKLTIGDTEYTYASDNQFYIDQISDNPAFELFADNSIVTINGEGAYKVDIAGDKNYFYDTENPVMHKTWESFNGETNFSINILDGDGNALPGNFWMQITAHTNSATAKSWTPDSGFQDITFDDPSQTYSVTHNGTTYNINTDATQGTVGSPYTEEQVIPRFDPNPGDVVSDSTNAYTMDSEGNLFDPNTTPFPANDPNLAFDPATLSGVTDINGATYFANNGALYNTNQLGNSTNLTPKTGTNPFTVANDETVNIGGLEYKAHNGEYYPANNFAADGTLNSDATAFSPNSGDVLIHDNQDYIFTNGEFYSPQDLVNGPDYSPLTGESPFTIPTSEGATLNLGNPAEEYSLVNGQFYKTSDLVKPLDNSTAWTQPSTAGETLNIDGTNYIIDANGDIHDPSNILAHDSFSPAGDQTAFNLNNGDIISNTATDEIYTIGVTPEATTETAASTSSSTGTDAGGVITDAIEDVLGQTILREDLAIAVISAGAAAALATIVAIFAGISSMINKQEAQDAKEKLYHAKGIHSASSDEHYNGR